MLAKKISLWITGAALLIGSANQAFAVSAAEKAKEKLIENQSFIVSLELSMSNFGSEDQKKKFQEIKQQYLTGYQLFLEKSYVDAFKKNLAAQIELEKLYEQVSLEYIERSTTILQELLSSSAELKVKYDKNTDLVKRMKTDRESPDQKRAYNPSEFHNVYDQFDVFANIKMGFNRVGDARRVRDEAIKLTIWYEKDKQLDPRVHAMRLNNYLAAINTCREAKKNAMNIYQLLNRNDIVTVQTQYKENKFANEIDLLPVFDPRIPDKYKKDASDALMLNHDEEVRLKIKGEGFENSEKSTSTSTNQPANKTN